MSREFDEIWECLKVENVHMSSAWHVSVNDMKETSPPWKHREQVGEIKTATLCGSGSVCDFECLVTLKSWLAVREVAKDFQSAQRKWT